MNGAIQAIEIWESLLHRSVFTQGGRLSHRFTQRSNILSNFHANAKYAEYVHNLDMTAVELHKKVRNSVKNARRGAAITVQINQSRTL